MRALRIVLLAALFGVGLWFIAWWTVPAIAALWALVRRDRSAPVEAMASAMLATLALLARHAISPSFMRLLEQLGQLFPVPGIAVLCIGLLLAMVLAFASARVVTGVVITGPRD